MYSFTTRFIMAGDPRKKLSDQFFHNENPCQYQIHCESIYLDRQERK